MLFTRLIPAAATLCLLAAPTHAAVVLYSQNFESPVGFVNDGGDVNIFRTVNQLYSNQPAGFQFAQANTVETLLVGGSSAWVNASNPGGGFKDPQGTAGRYVLGMLSSAQNDLVGLSFNIGALKFLNFQLDISSIDLNNFGGPFFDGTAPAFQFSLFDNPSGANGLGSGAALATATANATIAANRWTLDWTRTTVALDATGNTNGNVTLRVDLLNGGYAAMDNFTIAASDTPGDVGGGTVPEPGALGLVALAFAGLALTRRRTVRGAAIATS